MSRKDLPSVNDFSEDNSDLPSIEDFLAEEVDENLPSAEDFIEKEELVEETQTIEDLNGEPFAEIVDIVPAWPELVRMINDVRKDIPDIPEIKYYDKELEQLAEQISQVRDEIPEIPEVRYYEQEVEAICEQIDLVRSQIKDLPEVKYYDEQVDAIEDRIDTLQTEVANLPEVKYYDEEIVAICDAIDAVKASIPKFPKWVNEVNEVPDFSWIGKTFSVIDDDFVKVHDAVEGLRGKVEYDIQELSEDIDKKTFESKVELNTKSEEIQNRIQEEKDKIWKELRNSSMRIWEYHKEFKDDDKKLKKQILGEYNSLKQNIKKELKEATEESVKTDELLLKYFNDLRTEISGLPEIKHYDEDISHIKKDLKELRSLVKVIKTEQKELQEGLLNEPPSEREDVGGQPDPLTPMDQNFATLDDLASHYRLFINRIQQQISTIGGGGAGFVKDLADVTITDIANHDILVYDSSSGKWKNEVGVQRLILDARNNSGSDLDPGTPVYQTGYNSGQDRINIATSDASDSDTMPAKGVVCDPIGINSNGFIVVSGELEGVDTSAFDVGDELFVSVGGGLTATRPTGATQLVQKIATVLKKSAGNGAILVHGAGRTNDVPNTISIAGSITAANFFKSDGSPIAGAGGTWASNTLGIHTTKNVGIATTSAKDGVALFVQGDAEFTGNISVAGTISYDDVQNIDSLGIITARDDIRGQKNLSILGISTLGSANGIGTVHIGIGTTALLVDGNARILGILTVGRGSVTIDGDNNTVTSGIVTITNSTIVIGDNVTLSGNSSGINSAPNVLYVAKDGSDTNNGTSIDNAKLTISGAVGIATTGTVINVLAGDYTESNPIEVPAFVSIVGDDLKTVTVRPSTTNDDLFHVRKGCYISNMTFKDHVAPAAAVGFPTGEIATNVTGGAWESPYIQNCTSNTTTGVGLRVDGAQAESLKSIVCDSYTQYNQGGVGVAVTNEGFAQLVSIFTICCQDAISCHKGGQVDLTNSNASFGTNGLVADGVSDLQFTGIVTSSAAIAQDNVVVAITTTTRPYDGQLVYFDKLYQSVETITVSAGGTGYTTTPTVTIGDPTGPSGETATAFATLENDSVASITIISSGSQYESTPTITISGPGGGDAGINTATATISMAPIYYTINSSTPVTAGITTLTLDENLLNTVGVGSTAYFHQASRIVASSHTFEYVGSGNDITEATPKRGGVTVQANEVVTTNGGKVVYTSTDQAGNFRIGDELQINQNTGTISGRAFSKSLFSEMTPFILALS
jgi:hypothetical protein